MSTLEDSYLEEADLEARINHHVESVILPQPLIGVLNSRVQPLTGESVVHKVLLKWILFMKYLPCDRQTLTHYIKKRRVLEDLLSSFIPVFQTIVRRNQDKSCSKSVPSAHGSDGDVESLSMLPLAMGLEDVVSLAFLTTLRDLPSLARTWCEGLPR
jgi:hypothetical protein